MQAAVATVATVAVPAKGSAVRVWATAYDVRSASGKSAIVDAARRRARTALWMCWQQGYVPRDLATVASRLTEITLRGPVLALGKDGAAHDASPREVAVMRAYMQRGQCAGGVVAVNAGEIVYRGKYRTCHNRTVPFRGTWRRTRQTVHALPGRLDFTTNRYRQPQ